MITATYGHHIFLVIFEFLRTWQGSWAYHPTRRLRVALSLFPGNSTWKSKQKIAEWPNLDGPWRTVGLHEALGHFGKDKVEGIFGTLCWREVDVVQWSRSVSHELVAQVPVGEEEVQDHHHKVGDVAEKQLYRPPCLMVVPAQNLRFGIKRNLKLETLL